MDLSRLSGQEICRLSKLYKFGIDFLQSDVEKIKREFPVTGLES